VRVGDPSSDLNAPSTKLAPAFAARGPLDDLKDARRRFAESPGAYYNETIDRGDIQQYYANVNPNTTPAGLYQTLSTLVRDTHRNRPAYKPTVHLYPLVDLHPSGELVSIYSGASMNPEALILQEASIEAARESIERVGGAVELESIEENSAEHVVPQSWFDKREPMRGDLHHLFACERNCNSFRDNIPYFQFTEDAVMEDCGRREPLKFEPKGGKGPVARAVLYFLLRYPGEINNRSTEYTQDRVELLLKWHREFPVSLYERHRNREIFLKQGNRNPLIDHSDWAATADFLRGLGSA